MRNRGFKKFIKIVLVAVLCLSLVVPALADINEDLQEAKDLKASLTEQVAQSEERLEELQYSEASLEERIAELDAEIDAINEIIAAYEEQKQKLEADIEELEEQIELEEEEVAYRYEKMKLRIQYMYENVGDGAYVDAIFSSSTIGELLNKLQYIFDLNEYDSEMMDVLENLITQLEEDEAELEVELDDVNDLKCAQEDQRSVLVGLLETKNNELTELQAEIDAESAELSSLQAQIDSTQSEIDSLNAQLVPSGGVSYGSGSGLTIQGTGTGVEVVNYALQFVGNPYVWGGTSLTNGCDCSGFIMSVYAHFGVSLPHSSYSMRSCGTAVSASAISPGDIVCYDGHVALYIGGGQIVHAASTTQGIIISSNYAYRTVLAIRRIFT